MDSSVYTMDLETGHFSIDPVSLFLASELQVAGDEVLWGL